MCGRVSIHLPIPDLIEYFRLSKWLEATSGVGLNI